MKETKYSKIEVEKGLIRALKQVYDPDIQVNVYDLGLIYEIKVSPVGENICEKNTDKTAETNGEERNKVVSENQEVKTDEVMHYDIYIKMTLTSPTCPIADEIVSDVEKAAQDVPGAKGVKIELTFEPEWGIDKMSDEAKLELGLM